MIDYEDQVLGERTEELARRPYRIEMLYEQGQDVAGWIASVPELPGCLTQASSFAEAGQLIEEAKRAWIYTALADGAEVPQPHCDAPVDSSGKFLVRTPKSLHRKLAEAAARDGVSLNAWVNAALAEAVGMRQAAGHNNGVEHR